MNTTFKRLAVAAAFGAGMALSSVASANVICNGCSYVDPLIPGGDVNRANNLGTHNPFTGDTSTFTHAGLGNGNFVDWWHFTVSPAGLGGVNASFIPTFGVDNFRVDLFAVSASTCAANGASVVGNCTSVTLVNPLVPLATGLGFGPGGAFLDIPLLPLAGAYAFRVQGLSNDAFGPSNSYSGNITTRRIPEPGTLALVALALMGAGAAARRRA